MSVNIDGPEITLPASGDLSSYQFRCMNVASDGQAELANDADDKVASPIGILQNKPDAENEPAVLRVAGVAKADSGSNTIDEGDHVTCDSSGYIVATTTAGDFCLGIALEATSGGIVMILITHHFYEGS